MKHLTWVAATALTASALNPSHVVLASDTMLALAPQRTAEPSLIPTDRELEGRGARIGHIEIQVDDVFENTLSLSAPYKVANGLHISTHSQTVRQQLLFRSGEPFHRRVLDETERLLRGQRYLNEAAITVTNYNAADNTTDVLVRVHDVWTLSPGLSFGRKGGENSTRVKFEDTNFLGLGKHISLARSNDVDRNAWRLAYTDPNLLGSRWKLSSAYSTMSDGSEKALALARPFFSLDSRWSADVSAADLTNSVSRYSLGKRVERFDMQQREFSFGGGVSTGLRDGWVTRYLGGFRYDDRSFAARDNEPAAIPADRTLSYPWVGIEVLEDNYLSTRNLDQIGRTEDVYLGRSARMELGFASTALGSTRDAIVLNGSLQAGAELGDERYLINSIGLRGRLEQGELADGVLDANTRFYLRQSERSVFFVAASASLTSNLDPEQQLLLGGDNGLRGYPLRYQAGTANALLTLEERFYSSWQPLKLFNVGAAVFFDAGRSWGRDEFAAPSQGWLKDVGIGLRLGSVRSGLGNVLHIDLAMPLDRANGIDAVQLLVETRRSF